MSIGELSGNCPVIVPTIVWLFSDHNPLGFDSPRRPNRLRKRRASTQFGTLTLSEKPIRILCNLFLGAGAAGSFEDGDA